MEEERKPLENRNFIDAFIEEDLAPGGRFEGKRVHTRFPPEPNGYLIFRMSYLPRGRCAYVRHAAW